MLFICVFKRANLNENYNDRFHSYDIILKGEITKKVIPTLKTIKRTGPRVN